MFQDEQAIGGQYAALIYGPNDFAGNRIAIGWIGKDDVHHTAAVGKVSKAPNGVRPPHPAQSVLSVRTDSSMRALPTMLATESTASQVVPDHLDSTPVVIDEQTATCAPAQGFNTQYSAAGTQIQYNAAADSGRQDVEQRSTHATAGGANRTGYGFQPTAFGNTRTDT